MLFMDRPTARALSALSCFAPFEMHPRSAGGRRNGEAIGEVPHPILLAELLRGSGLPGPQVAKVFQYLVHAGILASYLGRGGGFMLARPATHISLADVAAAIQGDDAERGCLWDFPGCCGGDGGDNGDAASAEGWTCPLCRLYQPERERFRNWVHTTTLADLWSASREAGTDLAFNPGRRDAVMAQQAKRRPMARRHKARRRDQMSRKGGGRPGR